MERARRTAIVVGAGLTGLATAWRLSQRGLRVAVLERSTRAGGRCAAESVEGFRLEAVPPVLCAGDRRLWRLVGEVGLRDDLLPLRPLLRSFAHHGELKEVELRSLADVRRIPGVRWRQALRLVRLPRLLARYGERIDFARPEQAAPLDDRSAADFCRLYFGGSVLDHWMAPLVTSDCLGDPHEMSRVQVLHHLRRSAGTRPGLPRASLADVVERAAGLLATQLRVEVVGVDRSDDGRPRVRLPDGRAVTADAVVLALPAAEARRVAAPLLSTAEREGLEAVRYDPVLTVAAALCRPIGTRPQQILVPRSEGLPLESATLEPGLPGSRVPEGRGLVLLRARPDYASACAGAPDETLAKELLGALEALRPGVLRAVEFTRVLRIADGSPRFDVGRYRAIARFERVQRDQRAGGRRLYFAGDHLVHPSLEGAVVSAERAAHAVLEDLAGGSRDVSAPR